MLCRIICCAVLLFAAVAGALDAQQSAPPISPTLSARNPIPAPVVLCIDDKPALGGQPSAEGYAKAAANGFRSVVTLRSSRDGIDANAERFLVERHQLRYLNIVVSDKLPRHAQIDEFLRFVRDPLNHPMLINCAYAERLAPFMMMFRIFEEGWSEDRALAEAARSNLKKSDLQLLVRTYRVSAKPKPAR